MNLTFNTRDKVVLSVLTVVLVGAMWGYVRWATAPASRGRAIQTTESRNLEKTAELTGTTVSKATNVLDVAPAPTISESESPASLPRRDYRYIAERNIFQPSSESPKVKNEQDSQTTKQRARLQPPSGNLSSPPPLPPAPPPPPPSTPQTQMASRPANLTATGVTRIGDETYVLLENPQTRDIAFVKVGESAFGYQVVNVGENYVEVKQGDLAYRIVLGEGKQERRILAAASSGPRPPGQFGGPFGGPFPGPFGSPQGQFGQGQRGQGRGGDRGSTDWVNRVVERWNQLPEFVRDRIIQRVGEFWQQMPPEQQQQILQRFQQMGVNFNPPGR
ncbi:MAG: hypothetical protein NZ805_05660 [Armatimonadetes bacterium]|nr:hypothetical protein [Armatimonadota bacterium]MDW8028481.1 hypothetical protein [Armatimonadota bacterium]